MLCVLWGAVGYFEFLRLLSCFKWFVRAAFIIARLCGVFGKLAPFAL